MIVKLLAAHHLEFLSLKGGCRGLSESTHVKMPHCWKSHALAQYFLYFREEILTIVALLSVDSVLFTPQSKVSSVEVLAK